MKTGTQIYNENRNITFSIVFNGDDNDVRIEKFINGEFDNLFDGNWDLKTAKQKLFIKQTGMTKSHYNSVYKKD